MSRRSAEKLISDGRITLHGKRASLGDKIDPERDDIEIDGKKVVFSRQQNVYIMLNKPRRYITSASDEKGRRTVLDLIDVNERVYPIGRLDYDSEGLLLLTNDGDFANFLMHPSGEKVKTYSVLVRGLTDEKLFKLSEPIVIDGYKTRPARVRLMSDMQEVSELEIKLTEGRNRQIRRICEECELNVVRLRRTGYASLTLDGLKPGQWRYLTSDEVKKLKKR